MSEPTREFATPAPARSRQQAWSRYWASGARHSCVGSFADDYAGVIRTFWKPHLSALGPEARMLDIGTGNGPLVKLAVDFAPDGRLPIQVDAVDLAQPAPDWLATVSPDARERLRFHGGVAAEALPFADASFDLVTSQFGIEYADLDAALGEVFRVLAASGRVALVCHHGQSVLFSVAHAESGHLRWLVLESGLFPAAQDLLPVMARLATPEGLASVQRDAGAARLRAIFNQKMAALSARAGQAGVPDSLHETAEALMGVLSAASELGLQASLQRLSDLREALEDAMLRSAELCRHALDSDKLAAVVAAAAAARRSTSTRELVDAGRLIGWGIEIGPAR